MFDPAIIQWVQQFRSPALDAFFTAVTATGNDLFFTLLIPALYWLVDREKAHRLAVVLLASVWLNDLVKDWLAMPRPGPWAGVTPVVEAGGSGFPSGHAQASMTFWGWLAAEFPRPWVIAAAAVMVGLVSLSRLYLGVHFLGDVLGGWALGLAVLAAAASVWGSGAGRRWPLAARVRLGILVPLALWPLQPGSAPERTTGAMVGLLTVGLAALRYISYDPHGTAGARLARLLVGLGGLIGLATAVRLWVPPGLPTALAYFVGAAWVTAGAPLLFMRWHLAFPAPERRERARQRRIASIAAPSSPEMGPYLGACGAALACVVVLSLLRPGAGPSGLPEAAATAAGPAIVGHRGAAGLAPENTLEAFRKGLESGASWLELDVRLSADGEAVVIHDSTVDRTTEGQGPVAAMAAAEIQRLDAGFRFSPDGRTYPYRGAGLVVPTLGQVLNALPEARFVIEMKGDDPSIADVVVRVVQQNGASGRVILAAFHGPVLRRARSLAPGIATSAARDEAIRLILMQRLGLGAFARPAAPLLQLPERFGPLPVVTPALLRTARYWGVPVHVGVVNREEQMYRLVTMGVDGIVTDYPDRLAWVVAETRKATGGP